MFENFNFLLLTSWTHKKDFFGVSEIKTAEKGNLPVLPSFHTNSNGDSNWFIFKSFTKLI